MTSLNELTAHTKRLPSVGRGAAERLRRPSRRPQHCLAGGLDSRGAGHQRCRGVRFARNCWPRCPRPTPTVMGMVAAVSGPSSPPDAKTVATSWDDVRDLLSRSFSKVGQFDGRREGRGPRLHRAWGTPASVLDICLDRIDRIGSRSTAQAPWPLRSLLRSVGASTPCPSER